MAETVETTIPIQRVTVRSERPFDDVVTGVYAGLGRQSLGDLLRRSNAATTREDFDAVFAPAAGSSGLMEFLSLDLGAAITVRSPDRARRALRIIAGNPVTMSKMATSTPDAGSYAPVTILIVERDGGVTLSYDRVASAIAPYADDQAMRVAVDLDAAVVELLHAAAG
jgi:uncharacterized protein (DUF302 family)